MMKKTNFWVAWILVITLFTGGIQPSVLAAEQATPQGTITVMGMDASNPLLPETTVQFNVNETATEALVKTVGETNVEFTDTNYGKMLTGINGLKAEGTHYWAFFINGVSAQVGSDNYIVQNGDKLTFRYTDWTKTLEKTVSLKVLDQDKKTLSEISDVEIIGSPTAFQLLQAVLGPDKVGYSDSQYGKMITSINGVEATGTNFWAFYVDGQMAEVGADSYQLQATNQITFQLESWQDTPGDTNPDDPNPVPPSGTISEAQLHSSVDSASQYVLKSGIGEWEAVALKKAGKNIPATYLPSVKSVIKEKQGKFSRITDTERYVLGILAAGGDPTNVEGYNLIESIYNGKVTKQGLIGVSYALVALDSAKFSIPDSAQWTRATLVSYLMERQNADGGWAWDESPISDLDTTAMIVTSLVPYQDQPKVKAKLDDATQYLSAQYQASKVDNSSTAAQVIIALSSFGVDANGPLFTKEETSLMQYLLSFQNADGGFDWQGGDESDVFSTSQGLQALVAYQLFSQGKGSIYQLPLAESQPDGDVIDQVPAKVEQSSTQDSPLALGHTLPNTATNLGDFLGLGALFLMVGGLFYLRQRKQNA